MIREDEVKAMIKQTLASFAGQLVGHQVFLFGSRAAGRGRPRSDFDIGISGRQPLTLSLFAKIEEALDDLPTLYTIQLVDFNKVSPAFRNAAVSKTEAIL